MGIAKKVAAKAAKKPFARKPFVRKPAKKGDGEADVTAAIAKMPEPDRTICTKLAALMKETAPGLAPKTWYSMPAWATAEGKIVVFFQSMARFKTRYATLGFMHEAKLDDGAMWPVAFALTAMDEAEEKKIKALVKKAVG